MDRDQNIWGSSEGIFCLIKEKDQFINFPTSIPVKDDSTYFEQGTGFAQDDSNYIWAGQHLGRLAKIDPHNPPAQAVQSILTEINLPQVQIHSFISDKNGHIWLTSDIGLTGINSITNEVRHFGMSYGLRDLSRLSSLPNGEICIASRHGYYRFNPQLIPSPKSIVKPVIEEFKVFDQAYLNGKDPMLLDQVVLNYKENFFSFNFGSIDLNNSGERKYAYRLLGLQNDWVDAGESKVCILY